MPRGFRDANVPTQLLLLESEVRRNNIGGALRHYDRALRVSTDARDTLLPIIFALPRMPAIAGQVARLLDPRPPWWFAFGERLAQQSTSPAAMTMLLGRLRLDSADERERSLLIIAARRMVEGGAYRQAERLYHKAGGTRLDPRGNRVRNGEFDSVEIGLPPFDWLIVNESQLGGYKDAATPEAATSSAWWRKTGEAAKSRENC